MLSILMLNHEMTDSVQDSNEIISCISQFYLPNTDSKLSPDPILREMKIINYHPFHAQSDTIITDISEKRINLTLKNWDKKIINNINLKRSLYNV